MERELWSVLSAAIFDVQRSFNNDRRTNYPIAQIVRVYLWAVLHDRPLNWACRADNWAKHTRPERLPGQSTMSRRTRTEPFQRFLNRLGSRLNGHEAARLVKHIDGKPLTVANHSSDPDAAFGRGAGGKAKGFKLHMIHAGRPMPEAFQVQPLNVSEKTVAKDLIDQLDGAGYLVGDSNYDASHLFERAAEHHHQLIAPRRHPHTGLGHHTQSAYRLRCIDMLEPGLNRPCAFGRQLLSHRRQIESDFGNAVSFGGGLSTGLAAFVRRLGRVRRWVHAKLLINAARIHMRKKQRHDAA